MARTNGRVAQVPNLQAWLESHHGELSFPKKPRNSGGNINQIALTAQRQRVDKG